MTPLLIICVISVCFYLIFIKPFTYWKNKGVPQASIRLLWWGNVATILQLVSISEGLKLLYKSFPEARYVGTYQLTRPVLLIKDPELIKQITVKDFEYFMDHPQFVSEECDPLWGKNLVSLKGDKWKEMRATLSPSFTSSKMKAMFGLMSECAENFVKHFQSNNFETMSVELKDIFTRYTNDVIASASFGISCNSLKERENEFYEMGKEVTNFSGFWRNLSFIVLTLAPQLAKYLGLRLFSNKTSSFFRKLVIGNMKEREQNKIVRPDMIYLLMEAKKGKLKHDTHMHDIIDSGFAVVEESVLGKEEKRQKVELTDDDITAQALIFFFAGFDSVSTLMCFASYELAINPSIQQKLRDEIDNIILECNGKLTYETLLKMDYLDMVISETLRKWPSGVITDRMCTKPYTIQPERKDEKPIHLEKGNILWFAIHAAHHDEQFFSEPDSFDPQRFSSESKANIMPYSYIPFGVGPRSCIGNRFALLETKILFFYIIKNFEIVVTDKSVVPLKISRKQFNLTSENGFWFGFKPRKLTT